jgi:hypothetical protein
MTAGGRGDLAECRRLLAEGREIAQRYRMPEPTDMHVFAEAVFAHVEGRFEEAERLYTESTERMERRGSLYAGFLVLALTTLRVSQRRLHELRPLMQELYTQYGPLLSDVLTVTLVADGMADEARRFRADLPPVRPDYYFAVFGVIRAMAVVGLEETFRAQETYDMLLPIRGMLPGSSSLSLVLAPVEQALGDLALLLGRPALAREHFTAAVAVAEAWGSAHWASDARRSLDRLG